MCFSQTRILYRQLAELRTGVQIERRFSRKDVFTIYVNRLWFAENVVGVEDASGYFFRKHANELDLAEAALLAGMIQNPARFSPVKHPDRALQRRNAIIDAMLARGTINTNEATQAKSEPDCRAPKEQHE